LSKLSGRVGRENGTLTIKLIIVPDFVSRCLIVYYEALVKNPDNNVILPEDWHQI